MLLVVFGSVLAALLPVGLGVAAVLVTGAALYFLALATTMMELMGKWNWWLPRRLDRVLPRADFESGLS